MAAFMSGASVAPPSKDGGWRRKQFSPTKQQRVVVGWDTQMIAAFDGFIDNEGDFIIKAITFYNVTDMCIQQYVMAPPSGWEKLNTKAKKHANYVTRKLHGLHWYSGDIAYQRLSKIMHDCTDNVTHLYASGAEPVRFLSRMLGREVLDLQTCVVQRLPPTLVDEIKSRCAMLVRHRCMAPHDGFDRDVLPEHREAGCCFTRALRHGELLRAYNRQEGDKRIANWDDMFKCAAPSTSLAAAAEKGEEEGDRVLATVVMGSVREQVEKEKREQEERVAQEETRRPSSSEGEDGDN